jgi:hypothetical protein
MLGGKGAIDLNPMELLATFNNTAVFEKQTASYSTDVGVINCHTKEKQENHCIATKNYRRSACSTSNFLYLLGSGLYVYLAIWDIQNEKYWYSPEGKTTKSKWFHPYLMVSVAAASCYVIDALMLLCYVLTSSVNTNTQTSNESTTIEYGHFLHRFQQTNSRIATICVAVTFGLGAILDLLSAFTSEMSDPHISNWAVVGAAHSYLVNAIIVLSSKTATLETLSQRVTVLGDTLFLIGSLVDVSLSYFFIGEESDFVWKNVYLGYLFSSILWLINALLYFTADVVSKDLYTTASHDVEKAEVKVVSPIIHSIMVKSNNRRNNLDPLLEHIDSEQRNPESTFESTISPTDEYTLSVNNGTIYDR